MHSHILPNISKKSDSNTIRQCIYDNEEKHKTNQFTHSSSGFPANKISSITTRPNFRIKGEFHYRLPKRTLMENYQPDPHVCKLGGRLLSSSHSSPSICARYPLLVSRKLDCGEKCLRACLERLAR